MKFDPISVLIFLGVLQAILVAAALVYKKQGDRTANRLLAALLILLAMVQVLVYLYHSGRILNVPHLMRTEVPLLLLIGPLLLLYLRALTETDFKLRINHLLHALPLLIYVLYQTPFYVQSSEQKLVALSALLKKKGMYWQIEILLVMVHFFSYLALVVYRYVSHRKKIKNRFSSLEKINLSWIRNFVIGLTLVWLAMFFHANYPVPYCNIVFAVIITVLIVYVSFKGLTQPEIFTTESNDSLKYASSALTVERTENIRRKLENLMARSKPYTRSDLSLPILAKELSVSTHHLSQILNEQLSMRFFDYINKNRIEEAQRMLTDRESENVTISEIAERVGFNSISSFNTAFKKFAGVTPSQYRKQQIK